MRILCMMAVHGSIIVLIYHGRVEIELGYNFFPPT